MGQIEKYTKTSYTFALILILIGIFMVAFQEQYQALGTGFINAGSIIIFVTFVKARRYRNGPVKDERTIKIGAYGLSYSWLITFVLISLLFWIDEFEITQLTVKQVLAILMITMLVTAKGIQWYLFRKGDIE
jgi:drug/metabolite transporter (DMT)-like permease